MATDKKTNIKAPQSLVSPQKSPTNPQQTAKSLPSKQKQAVQKAKTNGIMKKANQNNPLHSQATHSLLKEKKAVKLKTAMKEVPQKIAPKVEAVKKELNIPNILTMVRIWAIPLIVLTFFSSAPFWAWTGVVLFAIAGITDYFDGYLARHLNQLSRFGRVLDPIADKLLVGAVLIMLAYSGRLGNWGIIPAVIILCREILVSGLREFLAEIKVGCPVTRLAKWKTACQMTALPVLMVADRAYSGNFETFLWTLGMIALWGAAILTVMTGYDYWKSGRRYMNEN